MGKITLAQAAQWCGGQVDAKYADVEFLGACGDHRWAKPGELYVMLGDDPYWEESLQHCIRRMTDTAMHQCSENNK